METEFSRSEFQSGALKGISAVADAIRAHFPATGARINQLADAPVLLIWFFVNFTVIFPLLRDNPVIQYFQLEHERYRAV